MELLAGRWTLLCLASRRSALVLEEVDVRSLRALHQHESPALAPLLLAVHSQLDGGDLRIGARRLKRVGGGGSEQLD